MSRHKKPNKRKSIQNPKQATMLDIESQRSRQTESMGYFRGFARNILNKPGRMLDCIFIWWFTKHVNIYKWFTGRSLLDNSDLHAQIDDLLLDKERAITENERLNGNISDLKNQNEYLNHSVKVLQTEVNRKSQEISELMLTKTRLTEEKSSLEKEKEDALRRLSELVSVRLRDNNPNIVDLNDPCRPTKLAEMFSELYDNEWTSAYAVLEGTFTETQAIVILLDTVMEAYDFCEERMEERWNTLEKWFLNSTLPGAQQTCKWLKDSRKATILEKLAEEEVEFGGLLDKMCNNEDVGKILSDKIVRSYITKCVELCLLMVTTDPPVVLGCPLWVSSKMMSATKEDVKNINGNGNQDEIAVDEEQIHVDTNEANNHVGVDNLNKSSPHPECDVLSNEPLSDAQEAGPDGGIANGTANKPAIEPAAQKGLVAVIPTKRSPFEKETFKEYTTRGKYLDFIVWPAMYLHKDGPLLAKGIAQGSKEEFNRQGTTSWIWRRKLPSDDE